MTTSCIHGGTAYEPLPRPGKIDSAVARSAWVSVGSEGTVRIGAPPGVRSTSHRARRDRAGVRGPARMDSMPEGDVQVAGERLSGTGTLRTLGREVPISISDSSNAAERDVVRDSDLA